MNELWRMGCLVAGLVVLLVCVGVVSAENGIGDEADRIQTFTKLSIPNNVTYFELSEDMREIVIKILQEREIDERIIKAFETQECLNVYSLWNVDKKLLFWIIPIYEKEKCIGEIALEPDGSFAYCGYYPAKHTSFSLVTYKQALSLTGIDKLGKESHGYKLILANGKRYWYIEEINKLVSIDSGIILDFNSVKKQVEDLSKKCTIRVGRNYYELAPNIVPYWYQGCTNLCGVFCAKMVADWWGMDDISIEDIREEAGWSTKVGGYLGRIEYAMGKLGFKYHWHGDMKSITTPISRGDYKNIKEVLDNLDVIVIVGIDSDGKDSGWPHYCAGDHAILILGYNDNSKTLRFHDPSGAWGKGLYDGEISYTTFEKAWNVRSCDKDKPGDWFPHYHYRLGIVLYPYGDGTSYSCWYNNPTTTISYSAPTQIYDSGKAKITFSMQIKGYNAWGSGIHVRVDDNGEITSAHSSTFKAQPYTIDYAKTDLPAPIVEFYKYPNNIGSYTASVEIKPHKLGNIKVKYRSWVISNTNYIHDGYIPGKDAAPAYMFDESHTRFYKVLDDDRPYNIKVPLVDRFTHRAPIWDTADWRFNGKNVGDTSPNKYATKTITITVKDDDISGPTFSNLKASPSSSVYDSYTGSIRIQGDVSDPSGIYEVKFVYQYPLKVVNPSGSSGKTYWYEIPRSEWLKKVGGKIEWRITAQDNDDDRPYDRSQSWSDWKTIEIKDDDVNPPDISNLKVEPSNTVYDSYNAYIRLKADIKDSSGISSVYFKYRYGSGSWITKAPAGSSGNTYWYDIPRSEWIEHVGKSLEWKVEAIDDDRDRTNDQLTSTKSGPIIQLKDDDATPPSYLNPKSSGDIYDSNTGSYKIQIDWYDSEGIDEVKFRYKFGSGSWSSWVSPTGSSGNTYWYDIPRNEWVKHVGKIIYWQSYAVDNDEDRTGDRLTKTTPTYTGGRILDDDTSGPVVIDHQDSGDSKPGVYHFKVKLDDPEGILDDNNYPRVYYRWDNYQIDSSHYDGYVNADYDGIWYVATINVKEDKVGYTIYWRVLAYDNDNDRANDRTFSWSPVYKGGTIQPPQEMYNVTVKTSGLDGYHTRVWVNGKEEGQISDNSPITLKFKKGTTHMIEVQRYVYDGGKTRFYCLDNKATVSSETTIIFNYKIQYKLETKVNPKNAGRIELKPTKEWFNKGESVTARAISSEGWEFVRWTYDNHTSEDNPITISINEPYALIAHFTQVDWNPWNDPDSDGGEKITTAELQEAIHCWLNDEPAPKTGAEITTARLQEVIHQWLVG